MREETRACVGQLVHVGHPPVLTFAADEMAVEATSKFLPLPLESYRVNSTTLQTITFDQDGMPNKISEDCALLAPTNRQLQDESVDDKEKHPSSEVSITNPRERNDQPVQDKRIESQTKEYTVDHIVKQFSKSHQRNYVVRWATHDDAKEPLKNIPQHLINAYREMVRKREKSMLYKAPNIH